MRREEKEGEEHKEDSKEKRKERGGEGNFHKAEERARIIRGKRSLKDPILKATMLLFTQQQHCRLHVCIQTPESKHQVMQQMPVPVGGHCLPPCPPQTQ